MHIKKLLSIGFVVLLLLSLVMVTTPVNAVSYNAPPGQAVIWVDPDYVNGSKIGVGHTFIVEVKINVSASAGPAGGPYGMFAFAYWFHWDDTLLTLISRTVYIPSNVNPWFWSEGHSTVENKLVDTDANTKYDRHSYSETALGTSGGFNGTMTLARYTFNITYQPTWWDASCPLDITNKGISDVKADPITTTVHDGLYEIKAKMPAKPKLYVDPPSIYSAALDPCKNFTVDIKIVNASSLYNFNFKLGFNETILEATKAEEGPFLKGFGTTTVNRLEINNTGGYVWINISLVTGGPATGDGILANVTFHVLDIGECVLDLYDTKLTDKTGGQIPHDVSDGYFNNILMPRIFVDPPEIIDPTMLPPAKFFINISIGNITNMYDYVFKLGYNTRILNCLGVEIIPFNDEFHFTSTVSVNDPAGIIYVNVTYFDPALPITTIPPVAFATIKFQVTGMGSSVFDLYDTYLSDPTGALIPHVATDGLLVVAICDVAILSVKPSTNATYVGMLVNITVVAGNEGDLTETFSVSAYYDNNLIGTKTVTNLPSKENKTLIFTWNTTGLQPCNNYTIKAVASTVPYETDTADNTKIDGKVKIKMIGDVDGDGDVDIFDVRIVGRAFGSAAVDDPATRWDETANWNPNVDFAAPYGLIDIFDVRKCARNYGKTCSIP